MSGKPIRIVVVAGSVRPGNFTGKALRLVIDEIAHSDDATVDDRLLSQIKAQIRLASRLVSAVTEIAVPSENGTNIAPEFNFVRRRTSN